MVWQTLDFSIFLVQLFSFFLSEIVNIEQAHTSDYLFEVLASTTQFAFSRETELRQVYLALLGGVL